MKKRKKLILLVTLVLIILLILFLFCRASYSIKVEMIDDFSPDRRLIVYRNDKKIEFKELQYTDGTYLCSGENPTVSYSEIVDIEELIVKINEKKQVVAKFDRR